MSEATAPSRSGTSRLHGSVTARIGLPHRSLSESGADRGVLAQTPDEAPGRDVRAVIPEDFLLDSGERLAAAEVVGRLHGADHGPLVGAAGGISGGRLAMCWWPWRFAPAARSNGRRSGR